MCGISGFLDRRADVPEAELAGLARAMSQTLRHRGPDDEGVWVDAARGVALAHRRLSIIDLSPEGHQPMLSACGRYVIVFNGEVYNFRALRAELEPLGHRFRGHSDTEIMLAAIREWGLVDAVRRFIGMFAFVLWDREESLLHLVRDRIGVKPLYYGESGGLFFFGSELKALRAHPRIAARIDRDALAAYLRYTYVPTPLTIYDGIFKLVPGTILTVSADHGVGDRAPVPYWSALEVVKRGLEAPMNDVADDEIVDRLDVLLRDAVKLRMEADVPLGAFLSGGIDSSVVVALMQAQSNRPIRTFTIGFHEGLFDEAPRAREVARHLETDHTELYVSPSDALALIPRIPEWYDEPFADSSQLPTYLVAQMTRRSVTVSLSGDGGDELFVGYDRYFWTPSIWRALRCVPPALRPALAGLFDRFSRGSVDRLVALAPKRLEGLRLGDRSHKFASMALSDSIDALYRRFVSIWLEPGDLVRGSVEPRGPLWDQGLSRSIPDFIARAQFLDLVTYLPDDIMTKVDRASMAVSLEAREPLLDHRVVEFAMSLPARMKVRGRRGKWALRQLLGRYVPPELFERPKMGFGVPIEEWLRGPLREWAEDLLDEHRLLADGYLEPRRIREKWREHLSGRRSWHYHLWSVLMFQAWKAHWA